MNIVLDRLTILDVRCISAGTSHNDYLQYGFHIPLPASYLRTSHLQSGSRTDEYFQEHSCRCFLPGSDKSSSVMKGIIGAAALEIVTSAV